MTKHILITGAAGGIGSVLTPFLAKRGSQIYALDDLSSGSWKNIEDHKNIVKITGSIIDDEILDSLPWEKFTHVIHLAAISSLPSCQINPEKAFSINLEGTSRIANRARANCVALELFINASTSAVYESNKQSPLTEDLEVSPHLIYPLTKKFSEDLLEAMSKDYEFPAISFRFFNVFGPMQDYERKSPPLMNYLVREFLMGNKPMLHSNGEQARDYISVDDICSAIDSAIKMSFLKYENFNLCSGQQLSVNQIVAIVKKAIKTDIEPNYRSAEMLWNAYDELFHGKLPLKKSAVEAETLKSSLGDSGKFRKVSDWNPGSDQANLLFETAKKAETYIKNNIR